MPRTIQEILDNQEELADKFENLDPDRGHERPIEEYLEARRLRISRTNSTATDVSSSDTVRRSCGPELGGVTAHHTVDL